METLRKLSLSQPSLQQFVSTLAAQKSPVFRMMTKVPPGTVIVALAAKPARIAWAIIRRGVRVDGAHGGAPVAA